MNIVILGAGQVGSELSEILAEEHDVTLIDINEEKLQKISDHNDLRTICGNCCYPRTLESADIASADLAVAMTQWDEVNMVACQMIKHINKKTKLWQEFELPNIWLEKEEKFLKLENIPLM